MEIKLPFIEEVPEFNPRHRSGLDPKLTPFEREVLDSVDVLEQKKDYAIKIAIRAFNLGLVNLALIVLLILVVGPQFISYIQKHVPFAEPPAVTGGR